MTMFNLRKNDHVTVKVVGKHRFTKKMLYEVEYEGQRFMVPMFEFQDAMPLPDTLDCLVQQVDDHSLYFKQNLSTLIHQRYKEGSVYEFIVEQDLTTTSTPHYKVSDGSGLFFKLNPQPGVKLSKRSKVKCRIMRIRGVDVRLQCVGTINDMVSGFKLPALTAKLGSDVVVLTRLFRRMGGNREVEELYNEGNPDWLHLAIDTLLNYFDTLRIAQIDSATINCVHSLERCIVWFLEDSDYFDKFPDRERRRWQTLFTEALRKIRALADAYTAVSENRLEDTVNRVFSKLEASGYLIDADHKLRVLRNILLLDPAALRRDIRRVTSILIRRHDDIRNDTSFRRAFVELLQLYIDHNRRTLDEMDRAETNSARSELDLMIRVIAMQQLLADDMDEDINDPLNRTRLYRYLTLRDNSGNDAIMNKALQALLACEKWKNEYSWREVEEIITLTSRLRQEGSCETLPAVYETPYATLTASANSIEITENGPEEKLQRVYPPAGEILWNNLAIELTSPLPAKIREPRTIPQYSRFWKEIERRILQGAESQDSSIIPSRPITTLPAKGQNVEIEITGVDPDVSGRLRCRVNERGLHGTGWLDIHDITGSDRELPYDIFLDDNGKPRIYPAEVVKVHDDDVLQFSMVEPLNEFLNSYINYDDIERCVILSRRGESCMTLSSNGFICNVEVDESFDHLTKGDVIEVTHIKVTGNWREGEFVRAVGGRIDYIDVMTRLMADYALVDEIETATTLPSEEESREEPQAAPIQAANRLNEDAMRELARLLESVGANEPQNNVAYNYFSYARLVAAMIGDEELTRYFERRCSLLEELDDFFTNGRVDLQRLETMMPDLLRENNSLSTDFIKLRILSVIDHNENNVLLWNLFNTDANESLQELARLVLAYNMLDGFKMREERLSIRHKLYSRLKMNVDKEPEVIAGGMEDLHTEFKTSIVYPANSMRFDAQEQTKVILKVIVSFLNTEGGVLYIGVSDEGYVRGLEYDLNYFGRKDHFDRYVHDNMRRALTFIPNLHNYVRTEWIEVGGKDIYMVTVNPISEPISVEGVYYYREGSSCVMVRRDQEEEFFAARRATSIPVVTSADESVSMVVAQSVEREQPRQNETSKQIATSSFRNNTLHDGYPGYRSVSQYMYIEPDLAVRIYDDDRWMEDNMSLAIAIHAEEEEGQIVVVAADGWCFRTEIQAFADNTQHLSSRLKPIFISPIDPDDRLIMIYRDSSGMHYRRMFTFEEISSARPSERGEILSRDIVDVIFCEIVHPESQSAFKWLVKKQRIGKDLSQVEQARMAILEKLSSK